MGFAAQAGFALELDVAPSDSHFEPIGQGPMDNWTTDTGESARQVTVRAAGTYDKLFVRCITNTLSTASVTFRFRVNGANGNQTVSFAAGVTGAVLDSSNSDAVVAGDEICLNAVGDAGGTGTAIFTGYTCRFDSTSNHVALFGSTANSISLSTASATRYIPFVGGSGLATTENIVKVETDVAGTLGNLQVNVAANGRSSTSTYRGRVNNADGNMVISVSASTTGILEDNVNSDSLAANDDINVSLVTGTGSGALRGDCVGATFSNASNAKSNLFSLLPGGNTRAASATTHYDTFGGYLILDTYTTESQMSEDWNFAATASNLKIYNSANSYAADATFRFRKNAGNGNQVVTITASTTGLFEDVTNSDTVATTDDISVSIVGGTSGSLTNHWYGVLIEDTTAAATSVKTYLGLATASVKTVNGLAIASRKTWAGLA